MSSDIDIFRIFANVITRSKHGSFLEESWVKHSENQTLPVKKVRAAESSSSVLSSSSYCSSSVSSTCNSFTKEPTQFSGSAHLTPGPSPDQNLERGVLLKGFILIPKLIAILQSPPPTLNGQKPHLAKLQKILH